MGIHSDLQKGLMEVRIYTGGLMLLSGGNNPSLKSDIGYGAKEIF